MNGKKLLVADDSLTIQKVIKLALSSEGYEIQTVSEGNEAIQQVSLFRPDVVLVDVALPGKDAFEVKRAINQQSEFAHVRFVLMMSAFEKVDEAQSAELGFHGRLTKPFDPAHLRQVISDVLQIGSGGSVRTTTLKSIPTPSSSDPSKPKASPPPPPTMRSAARSVSPITPPPFGAKSKVLQPNIPPPKPAEPPPPAEISLDPPAAIDPSSTPFEMPPAGEHDLVIELDHPQAQIQTEVAPPARAENSEVSDIRKLTESTIRMSGLDDFEWSVSDDAKKKNQLPTQAAAQRAPIANDDTSPFPFDPSQAAFASDPAQAYHSAPDETSFATIELDHSPRAAASSHSPSQRSEVSDEKLEQLVSEKVEAALQKMAQKLLPEVAERIIKQEIRRMLEQQP